MLTYETIKTLCKNKGVTVTGLEKELGFSRGSLCKVDTNKPSMEKVQKLADYFNVSVDYLMTGEKPHVDYVVMGTDEDTGEEYYLNIETAQTAQQIFEKDRVLFDVYRSADKDRLIEYAKKLKALQDLEQGEA